MSSNYGSERLMTTLDEHTSPNQVPCPQCYALVVPRGILSTLPGTDGGGKHCPNCGHMFGWDSVLDHRVTGVVVTGAGGATTITTDGGTLAMTATVTPDHAQDKSVAWSVTEVDGSATTKATVDANGLVTAVSDGTVRVMAKANAPFRVIGYADVTITNQV